MTAQARSPHYRSAAFAADQRQVDGSGQSRADCAEDYAVNAIVMAAMDADEAEEPVLDAVAARIDAETVQASASP